MAAEDLTELWNAAMTAKPPGWQLMGLRCASTGLRPEHRSDDWIAEACGPGGRCIAVRTASAQDALRSLTIQLTEVSR